jgi:hemerythrin superfamily protein
MARVEQDVCPARFVESTSAPGANGQRIGDEAPAVATDALGTSERVLQSVARTSSEVETFEGEPRMNAIELLKEDHDKVERLFKSFESAKESEEQGTRQEIARQICLELTVHASVEEELFYPAVDEQAAASEDEEVEHKLDEADEEHRLVKVLVAEISEMEEGDLHFDAKVKVLKDLVEHHVEEEEGALMPRAQKLLPSDVLEALGTQIETRKQELMAGGMRRPARRPAGRSTTRTPSRTGRSRSAGSRQASTARRSGATGTRARGQKAPASRRSSASGKSSGSSSRSKR